MPHAPLVAPAGWLSEAEALLRQGRPEDALTCLVLQEPRPPRERLWWHVLRGLALVDRRELDRALEDLLAARQLLVSLRGQEADAEAFRVVARGLKKVGWIHRQKKDYERAYAWHSIEFQYLSEHGSHAERHASAVSLDFDAYLLGDYHLCESWGRQGLLSAGSIEEGLERNQALGMSWNNLAGTLSALSRFPEAEEAIQRSLDHWREYEKLGGAPAEARLAWAYFGMADVQEAWAKSLSGDAAAERYQNARWAFGEALRIARERGLGEEQLRSIRERIAALP